MSSVIWKAQLLPKLMGAKYESEVVILIQDGIYGPERIAMLHKDAFYEDRKIFDLLESGEEVALEVRLVNEHD